MSKRVKRAGLCPCGHVLDRSRDEECRHCARARVLLALSDEPRTLEAARARLARGRDTMREHPQWNLASLTTHVRPVVRS